MVERNLAKVDVVGSNPISRSIEHGEPAAPSGLRALFFCRLALLVSESHPKLQSFPDAARDVFRGWERLRLLYLIILVPSAIAMARWIRVDGPQQIQSNNDIAMTLVVGGLFANVCFFAGPLVEVYSRWLGFAPRWLRPALFTAGTILTLVMALAAFAVAAD